MNLRSIEITNIKGIGNRKFNLDIVPNKPNILVAPNGFGKSSFAIAFDSLKNNKIELDDKNYHLKDTDRRPILALTLTNGTALVADDTQNTISDLFDVFVIKNQTEPKSTIQSFGGRTFAKTSLNILPTTLVQTIPAKVDFNYSSSDIKTQFGTNGNKILTNISSIFQVSRLILRIENEIDFSRFNLKKFKEPIADIINKINQRNGTKKNIKEWIVENSLTVFQGLDEFTKLAKLITSFELDIISDEVDSFLAAWQIISVKNEMGANYKKACKYLYYLADKEHYTETISAFNPVKERFDIKPKKEKNSLVVNWPKAHEISNGQRDILTFITLLLKSKRNFKKKDCILIIDEIFDYMDDANLISFQYYISKFIDEMKRLKRRIFPILLTHLDPLFFNHFCFNDKKLKVSYLKEINIKSNNQILKLIYKRSDPKIQNKVDEYYFHYHPNKNSEDLTTEFKELKLNSHWAKPDDFFKKVYREVRRYLFESTKFDPLAICFAVRVSIEELVYNRIDGIENKRIFLEERNGTKNKLHFAYSIGVNIPETYFLLGIIYNTSLHLSEGQDVSTPLGLKLENDTIKKMMLNIYKEKVDQ